MTFTNTLEHFGHYERECVIELLSTWNIDNLPAEFKCDNIKIELNLNDGDVYLINSIGQKLMVNVNGNAVFLEVV